MSEHATRTISQRTRRRLPAAAFLALAAAAAWIGGGTGGDPGLLLGAALTGSYLALNIGANDAANNIGPLVGAGALGLGAALVLAAVGELSGAFLASEPVSLRLRAGLFNPGALGAGTDLARVLLAGMTAAGLWLHGCTLRRIPVSGTHSLIGGLLGAGVYARGWGAVQWRDIGHIAALWLATPVAAAFLAALVLHVIERTITEKPNAIGAARSRVPALIAGLSLLLANYFFVRLASNGWKIGERHLLASAAVALAAFVIAQPLTHRVTQSLTNNRRGVNELFTGPLILAGGFFAFAHGANDVANIAGPLTALANIAASGVTAMEISIPTWALVIGGGGIAVGLAAYGGRIVRTVGRDITEIDKLRAFCIAFSAALVVLAATHFGFPVSTTHTLLGSIVGVGLMREVAKLNEQKTLGKIRKCYAGEDPASLEAFLGRFQSATLPRRREMLESLYEERGEARLTGTDRERIHTLYHRQLVHRTLVRRIVVAWLATLPCAALLGALGYATLDLAGI